MEFLEPNSFKELKDKAWEATQAGVKCDFTQEWEDRYIKRYAPCSTVWTYEKVIKTYRSYLSNEITEEQAKITMEDLKQDFEKTSELFKNAIASIQAEEEAFKKAGIKYGTVEFTCPICGGTSHATRQRTPDSLAHKVNHWGGCKGCGYRSMN